MFIQLNVHIPISKTGIAGFHSSIQPDWNNETISKYPVTCIFKKTWELKVTFVSEKETAYFYPKTDLWSGLLHEVDKSYGSYSWFRSKKERYAVLGKENRSFRLSVRWGRAVRTFSVLKKL